MRLAAPDRRKRLLATALELFSQQGFRGTTTRAIARRSGVSEALLFRHFPTKEDLYWAVLEEQCAERGARTRVDVLLQAEGEDVDRFAAFSEDILSRHFADSRLYRLLLFSALESHELSHRFFRTYISDYYDAVAEHIRERIKSGRFRKVDPLLAARLFIGMSLHYFLVEELFKGSKRPVDLKKISRTAAEVWLAGMQSPAAARHANNTARKPSKSFALRNLEESQLVR